MGIRRRKGHWRRPATVIGAGLIVVCGCGVQGLPIDLTSILGLGLGTNTAGAGAPGQTGAASGPIIAVADYGDPDQYEQFFLELINRARRNPTAEAARLGLASPTEGATGRVSALPSQPLAMSGALLGVARSHSKGMIQNNFFSSRDPNGQDEFARIGARFPALLAGENIGRATGFDPAANTRTIYENMFIDADVPLRPDRARMLNGQFKQIGVGIATGRITIDLFESDGMVATADFAASAFSPAAVFVTGVVYSDGNGNGAYDPGEGTAGVAVSLGNDQIGAASARTAQAGGYAFQVFAAGIYLITFRNDPALAIIVDVRDKNIKVDLKGTQIEFFDPNQ